LPDKLAYRIAVVERGSVTPLRVYRVAAGLTLAELARIAGISKTALCHIERREAQPQRSTRRVLASALGVESEDLFPPPNDERPPAETGAVQESGGRSRHDTE
jgi:transcriptional regulator with XRE-family HTH domain